MAAQAKTFPNLKPADSLAESFSPSPSPSSPQFLRPEFDPQRRRLSVSEKLAEGRGFWRGVFAGVSIGTVAGFSGSIAMMNVWVPQVMNVAQQAWVASSVFGGAPGQAEHGQLTVRATGQTAAAVEQGVVKP
ncbi:MAG: hypothetical protein AB7O04_11750 [Hyphomonadaceae bacterium]